MIHQSMFWMDMAVSLGVIGTIRHSEPQWMLTASAASKDGSTLWSAHVISDGCQCLCCETPRDPSTTMSSSKMMLLPAKNSILLRGFRPEIFLAAGQRPRHLQEPLFLSIFCTSFTPISLFLPFLSLQQPCSCIDNDLALQQHCRSIAVTLPQHCGNIAVALRLLSPFQQVNLVHSAESVGVKKAISVLFLKEFA